ncbi:CP4-57 regulatory protein AlpA [Rhizobium sp. PP-CC-3A-592]|nr:CP4-57 regulatory protein AlpA [Rhizobium sp. PP-CC-3A-592]
MTARTKNERYLSRPDVLQRYGISRWTLTRWIDRDKDFPIPIKLNGRDYWSDYDLCKFEAARGGADPDTEGRVIGLKPVSGVITDYQQLVDALVSRRNSMDISSMELDARCGMQEGYTSKLENYGRPQGRGLGPDMFPLWLGGLKVGLVLVDLPRRPRKHRA